MYQMPTCSRQHERSICKLVAFLFRQIPRENMDQPSEQLPQLTPSPSLAGLGMAAVIGKVRVMSRSSPLVSHSREGSRLRVWCP